LPVAAREESIRIMAARPPRHLAEPPLRLGGLRPQVVFVAALLSIALVTVVIALVTRDQAPAPRRAAPATTAPGGRGGATTPTTAPAGGQIRPTPGNLLQGADFERDLAGWAPLGGTRLQRVEGGTSGRWAVAVAAGETAPGPTGPGLVKRGVASARAGTTYEASVWVRSTVSDAQVILALHEETGDRVAASDTAAYGLPDDGWRQLAVEHRARVAGSSLVLEITGLDLGDGRLLVDLVDVQVE
jgi:hypothetical protein